MKLVWLSDLHFRLDAQVFGRDPRVHLEAAVDRILAYHSDAALCLFTGDLADSGSPKEYAAIAEALARLPMTVAPLMGNHDARGPMRQAFDFPESLQADFIQYALDLGPAVVLGLDSMQVGESAGEYCTARLTWLAERLEQHADRNVYLALHHPPVPLALPMQDEPWKADMAALQEVLTRFGNVRHIMCGHVHRPVQASAFGIPLTALPSMLFNAPPPQPAWDWDSFEPSRDDPSLGVVHLRPEGLIIQQEAFMRLT